MMLIPKRIEPYFKKTYYKCDSDKSLIEGMLICCNAHNFEVFVTGEIKHRLFSKIYLLPENDRIGLEVRCKQCGKTILVFDSSCDGYEQCTKMQRTYTTPQYSNFNNYLGDGFSVVIKYEYPDSKELKELGIDEIDNAFSWIWITLVCNKSGKIIKRFIDYETA